MHERKCAVDAYRSSLDERSTSQSSQAAGAGSSVRDVIEAGRAAIARARERIDRSRELLDRSTERVNRAALSAREEQAMIDAEKAISAQLLEEFAEHIAAPHDNPYSG